MSTTAQDKVHMQEALVLARSQLGKVWPNPAVGCLIVKNGEVIGRGVTQEGGRPHAEVIALNEAGPDAYASTAYVTLEPCSHWGQSPPCVDALIDAGVARVVVTMLDPDERVNGSGIEALKQAGVEVEVGLCAEEAEDVNGGFFNRVATGRPLISILDADELRMGDLFYGATFFDAVLTDLKSWMKVAVRHKNAPLCIVVDDTDLAPAVMGRKSSEEREAIWLVMAKGRLPSRINTMRTYVDHIIEIDVFEGGHMDMEAIINALGAQGLTRVAVEQQSDLAKALKLAGLA